MASDSASPRGRPKGEKRARTRAALLDAAVALTREKGLERTTLQEVAERAGMSTGAIYGNFRNRDELFMALAERQWGPIRPRYRPGMSFPDMMRTLAEAVIAAVPDRAPGAANALAFRAYVLTHEEAAAQFRDTMARGYDAGAAWLRATFDPAELPMPADVLVRVINAVMEGLLFQRFLTPDLTPDDVIYSAFAALARPARPTS